MTIAETQFMLPTKEVSDALAGLSDAFLKQETVPAALLDQTAERMATNIIANRPTEGTPIIINPLYGAKDKVASSLTDAEVAGPVRGLRVAVEDRLRSLLPGMNIVVVEDLVKGSDRVALTTGAAVLKTPIDWTRFGNESEGRKAGRLEALRTLYGLAKRSPYIAYNVSHMENGVGRREGMQLQHRLEMSTLNQLVFELDEQKPTCTQALTYVEQAMEGAAFLVSHDLRLTDLRPANIGIDRKTNTAFLFDMDGLTTCDRSSVGYMAHSAFWPPERVPESSDDWAIGHRSGAAPVQEAEMVYEFGLTLAQVGGAYANECDVSELSGRMMSMDPNDRPTLREAIALLQTTKM